MGKKIIIAIVIIIFLIAATIAGVYLVTSRESKDIRTKAAPTTAISLIPAASTKAAGDTFVLHVEINTGGTSAQGTGNQVVSADVIIKFDPTILEATNVADGTFFSNPQVINNTIDPKGSIIYSSRVASKDDAVSGIGTLALITFKAVAAGSDTVSFTELTSIYGL